MKKVAVIPARYASTRFPAKLMQLLGDKTIIQTTYENTLGTNLFDDVMVATDSEIIFHEIKKINGNVVMSKKQHESGSDRIAEAIENIDCDVVINVQGDEPFVNASIFKSLLYVFEDKNVEVASLMHQLSEKADINNPNNVKVVVDKKSNALLFSRSVIPFIRDESVVINFYKHIGVYAYRKNALLQFTQWQPTLLELAEKLEQLRYLENGVSIKMIEANELSIGIDTPEDLEMARQYLNKLTNTYN